jgi:DNA-binding transcriptional ArsR family regulator
VVSSKSKSEAMMNEILVISDPEKIRILMDETRREILKVMNTNSFRDGKKAFDMSVGEIAEALGSQPQRIYHHIDKLVEAGFVVKSREEKKTRSIVTYYKRTAKAFIIAYEESDVSREIFTKRSHDFLATLQEAFKLKFSPEEVEELSNLISKLWKNRSKHIESLSKKLNPDFKGKDVDFMFRFLREIMECNDSIYKETIVKITKIVSPKL